MEIVSKYNHICSETIVVIKTLHHESDLKERALSTSNPIALVIGL